MKKFIYVLFFVFLFIFNFNLVMAEGENASGPEGVVEVPCALGVPDLRVIYDTNGGNNLESDLVLTSLPANANKKLQVPVKDGYNFEGWYYDKELTQKVDSDLIIKVNHEKVVDENGCATADEVYLYAKWGGNTNPSTGASFGIFFTICLIVISLLVIAFKKIGKYNKIIKI